MIVVFDVGNTETTVGLFDGEALREHWRLTTHVSRTADEMAVLLYMLLHARGVSADAITGSAIGSVVPPRDVPTAVGLEPGTRRVELLAELVPALRSAAFATGSLGAAELAAYEARDMARGRRCVSPAVGVVEGISAAGELRVRGDDGRVVLARGGSLIFDAEAGS